MASKASQSTIRNKATPSRNTPGTGIICGKVCIGLGSPNRAKSGLQVRAYRNFGFEEFRNRAANLRVLYRGVKFGLIRAGNLGDEIQVALGDRETVAVFRQRDGGGGLQFF